VFLSGPNDKASMSKKKKMSVPFSLCFGTSPVVMIKIRESKRKVGLIEWDVFRRHALVTQCCHAPFCMFTNASKSLQLNCWGAQGQCEHLLSSVRAWIVSGAKAEVTKPQLQIPDFLRMFFTWFLHQGYPNCGWNCSSIMQCIMITSNGTKVHRLWCP